MHKSLTEKLLTVLHIIASMDLTIRKILFPLKNKNFLYLKKKTRKIFVGSLYLYATPPPKKKKLFLIHGNNLLTKNKIQLASAVLSQSEINYFNK